MIFIDEVDALLPQRNSSEAEHIRKMKNQLLMEMDGVLSLNDGVVIIGANNLPSELDIAARRRFEKTIYLTLPTLEERILMAKWNFK